MKRVIRAIALVLLLACLLAGAEAERLDDGTLYRFYENSAFFGDSITRAFAVRVADLRQADETVLQGANFYGTGSITLYDGSRPVLVENALHFNYRGTDATLYYITAVTNAKKIFIMLGMNDPAGIQIERGLKSVEDILYYLRRSERTAGVEVCFFSVTPVGKVYCQERNRPDYQKNLDEFNARLREKCAEIGAGYIDVAGALKGEDGHLDPAYSADGERFHLNAAGLDVWLACLRDFAQEQYDLGLWDPFAEGGNEPGGRRPATQTDLNGN